MGQPSLERRFYEGEDEEPTDTGRRPAPAPRASQAEVQALESLSGALKTYGFRVALLVPEVRKAAVPEQVRSRLARDLRDLSAMFQQTAAVVDPDPPE